MSREIYISSDFHWAHTNLVKGCTTWDISTAKGLAAVRDFETLKEMNETLVANINSTVSKDDELYFLGDWSFGGIENVQLFRDQINCNRIHFLFGNHDHHIRDKRNGLYRLFQSTSDYKELNWGSGKSSTNIILFHYPIAEWNRIARGAYMLHGHRHSKGPAIFGEGRIMDVGICGSPGFKPYHLDEVINTLSVKKILKHH